MSKKVVSIVDKPESEYAWNGDRLKPHQINVRVEYADREPSIHTFDRLGATIFRDAIYELMAGSNYDKVTAVSILERETPQNKEQIRE